MSAVGVDGYISIIHFYRNWAKERIDEMDAALASVSVS